MTEPDAGVLTYAGQAHTVFVTHRALMVIKVCMALAGREEVDTGEQKLSLLPKIGKYGRRKA